MATLNLAVLKNRQTSKKNFIIYVSIFHKGETRYIATEYEIEELFQFDKGKVVCKQDAKVMNQRLNYVLNEYIKKLNTIQDQNIYNCTQIKQLLVGEMKLEQDITIKEYMSKRIEKLLKDGRNGYANMNQNTLNAIINILGDITLKSISTSTIKYFSDGLSKYSNATKQMRLAHLKATLNEAIKDGIVKYDIHPFAYTKMPKSPARLMDITIDEFIKIKDFQTKQKKLSLAKDVFLLSFYLGGINFIDLVGIDFSKDYIEFERQKTEHSKQGDKVTRFTIPNEAKPIIKKYKSRNGKLDFGYKFTYSNLQKYINHCMKKLAKLIGIESNFTYYSARKTFAQFSFDLGIRTEIVEYCIGQSMKENRPIYNYVRVMQKQADAAIQKVIDYTNNPIKYESYINMSAQMYAPMFMQNNC